MITCTCGHTIGLHSADGCSRKECACLVADQEVLQRAIDDVRTPYVAGEQRWTPSTGATLGNV